MWIRNWGELVARDCGVIGYVFADEDVRVCYALSLIERIGSKGERVSGGGVYWGISSLRPGNVV